MIYTESIIKTSIINMLFSNDIFFERYNDMIKIIEQDKSYLIFMIVSNNNIRLSLYKSEIYNTKIINTYDIVSNNLVEFEFKFLKYIQNEFKIKFRKNKINFLLK